MHGFSPDEIVTLRDIPQSLLESLVARQYLLRLNVAGEKKPVLTRNFCSTD